MTTIFDENSRIYNFDTDTINDVSVTEIKQRLAKIPKLPKGVHARCELHNLNFKSLDDLQKHNNEMHDPRKVFRLV